MKDIVYARESAAFSFGELLQKLHDYHMPEDCQSSTQAFSWLYHKASDYEKDRLIATDIKVFSDAMRGWSAAKMHEDRYTASEMLAMLNLAAERTGENISEMSAARAYRLVAENMDREALVRLVSTPMWFFSDILDVWKNQNMSEAAQMTYTEQISELMRRGDVPETIITPILDIIDASSNR